MKYVFRLGCNGEFKLLLCLPVVYDWDTAHCYGSCRCLAAGMILYYTFFLLHR
jgi:hypothetical protein